jgi:hypothetical protein
MPTVTLLVPDPQVWRLLGLAPETARKESECAASRAVEPEAGTDSPCQPESGAHR